MRKLMWFTGPVLIGIPVGLCPTDLIGDAVSVAWAISGFAVWGYMIGYTDRGWTEYLRGERDRP